MSLQVREADVDVAEIRAKLKPQDVEEAAGHVKATMALLNPLRAGHIAGTSPEILRALLLIQQALDDALEPGGDE